MLTDQTRWSLGRGKPLVPSRWQATVAGERRFHGWFLRTAWKARPATGSGPGVAGPSSLGERSAERSAPRVLRCSAPRVNS